MHVVSTGQYACPGKREAIHLLLLIRYRQPERNKTMNKLTPQEEYVILHKGTEAPFSGEYDDFYEDGTFVCRRCNAPLFSAKSKFDAVKRLPDPDGRRTEIECANCGGHLGHVFIGERLTAKNTRHCVNSLSIRFIPKDRTLPEILHQER
jgi:peptide-methionine (R)-S-oxide reductase